MQTNVNTLINKLGLLEKYEKPDFKNLNVAGIIGLRDRRRTAWIVRYWSISKWVSYWQEYLTLGWGDSNPLGDGRKVGILAGLWFFHIDDQYGNFSTRPTIHDLRPGEAKLC